MIEEVKKFVTDSFTKDGKVGTTVKHSFRVVDWIKALKPDADDALIIAGLAHDIERAFQDDKVYDVLKEAGKGFTDEEFLTNHQEKSAKIIAEFLEKNDASDNLTERVKMLVSKHELGGNDDQNLLKDADSLSFFENNINHFLTNIIHHSSKESIREKFEWMYDRITSDKAQQIAKPWYEQAMKELDKIN